MENQSFLLQSTEIKENQGKSNKTNKTSKKGVILSAPNMFLETNDTVSVLRLNYIAMK